METYLLDWANLLLRWLHVITAIAWIGSSFYFVWLDNSLEPVTDESARREGVGGTLWSVHGGGFYNARKFPVGPLTMPRHLHWFYWESYSTWLSGFALFVVLYLWNAGSFLVDTRRMDWAPWQAGTAALAFLAAGWLVYDQICRRVGQVKQADGSEATGRDTLVLALLFAYTVFAAWLACRLFPGRAAFLITGAMLATIMSANVFFWIIPGQRMVVEDLKAGRPLRAIFGQRGKQRSVHNTYFTLPVLIAMLSNHYGWLVNHDWNWLVLSALMLVGALVRSFFVARHKGAAPWPLLAVSLALLAALVVALRPAPAPVSAAVPAVPTLAQVRAVLDQRCVMCHNAQLAQKNVALHEDAALPALAAQIRDQVVTQRLMPLNNATGITEDERALLGRWVQAGAPLR